MAIARESLKASPIAPAKMAAMPPQIAIHANFFGSVTVVRSSDNSPLIKL
jgi:hypothetical protein